MLQNFKQEIETKSLFGLNSYILATVSGGADSIVLVDLLSRAGYKFAIAHCNFKLRGEESDGDEQFVETLSKRYDVPYYSIKFDTQSFADANGISIEMAARDLRYKWFAELAEEHKLTHIATGHHRDDLVETMILNLVKGTGIRGVTGIKSKRDNIVRPLLFSCRDEIISYIEQRNLTYREDSSNSSITYQRNLIRHKIAPLLKELNPSYRDSIYDTSQNLSGVAEVYNLEVDRVRKLSIRTPKDGGNTIVDINEESLNVLYELLRPYNFNRATTNSLIANIKLGESGKWFQSPTHKALRDRNQVIVIHNSKKSKSNYNIDISNVLEKAETVVISDQISLHFEVVEIDETFVVERSRAIVYLDLEKVTGDLKLRSWKEGDSFTPFGMRGKKMVSDYFIDRKFSIVEKQNQLILTINNDIAWLINERADNRFRLAPNTKKAMKISQLTK